MTESYKASFHRGTRRDRAVPGMGVGVINETFPNVKRIPAWNKSGEAKHSVLVTLPATVDNSATYKLTIQGVEVSVTTDSSATTAELKQALLTAHAASNPAKAVSTMESYSTNSLLIKAKYVKDYLVVTPSSNTNAMTVATLVGASYESWLITIPSSPDADFTYELLIDNVPLSYKTDSSPTQIELLNGLYNNWRMHPQIAGKAVQKLGTSSLLVTTENPFSTMTIRTDGTEPTNALVVAKQSSAKSTQTQSLLKFGTFVAINLDVPLAGYMTKNPGAATDKIVGMVDRSRYFELKNYQAVPGAGAIGYEEGVGWNESYSLIVDTLSESFYAPCIDSSVQLFQKLYVSYAEGTQGWVTTSSTNAIDVSPSKLSVEISDDRDPNPVTWSDFYGCYLVGVKFSLDNSY